MLSVPSFLAPVTVCANMLNKLLRREDWARDRLAAHAGKTVQFVVGRWTMAFSLQASGYVQVSDPAIVPNVTLTIPTENLSRLPQILRSNDPQKIAELMHIQGEASLAQVVSDLARELRWDVEDDLAKVFGDAVAVRLLDGIKSVIVGAQKSSTRLGQNMSEYLSEENQLVLARPAYEQWRAQLCALQARLLSLEHQVARLQQKQAHSGVNQA